MHWSLLCALSAAFNLHLGFGIKQTLLNTSSSTSTSHATPAHFTVLRYNLGGPWFRKRKAVKSGVSRLLCRRNNLRADVRRKHRLCYLLFSEGNYYLTPTGAFMKLLNFYLHNNIINVVFFQQPFSNTSFTYLFCGFFSVSRRKKILPTNKKTNKL